MTQSMAIARSASGGGWVETYRGAVAAWECDVFGHLNIAFYGERFADASLDLLDRSAAGRRWRTSALDISYRREYRAGEAFVVRSGFLAADPGSLRIGHNAGDGATLAEHRLAPCGADPVPALPIALAAWQDFPPVPHPWGAPSIPSGRDRVKAWETTGEGTLSLLGHLHRFSNACLHVIDAIGMDESYRRTERRGFSTFETRLEFADATVGEGEGVVLSSGVLAIGGSSIRMFHVMARAADGAALARFHQAGVHFDLETRRSAPWPDSIRARAAALARTAG